MSRQLFWGYLQAKNEHFYSSGCGGLQQFMTTKPEHHVARNQQLPSQFM
jgi:hypothetical protein